MPLPEPAEPAIWEGRAARRRLAPSTDRGGHHPLALDMGFGPGRTPDAGVLPDGLLGRVAVDRRLCA